MSKKNKDKDKPISLDETVELLGANPPEDIGTVQLDPLGISALAESIARRLSSKGGRPTDRSWEISRKVPMKRETWVRLKERAAAFRKVGKRVAAGQLAAIILEDGIRLYDSGSMPRPRIERPTHGSSYPFPEETQEDAQNICSAVEAGGLW